MNEEKEILDEVQSQISSFDNKASILLSVVGIIFALTLSILDVFHSSYFQSENMIFKVCYIIAFMSYIVVTAFLIICLLLVILPRKNKSTQKYPNYFNDINNMTKEELNNAIKNYKKDSTLILDQIKINSSICARKQKWLKVGILFLIPFIILMVLMIFMTIFA